MSCLTGGTRAYLHTYRGIPALAPVRGLGSPRLSPFGPGPFQACFYRFAGGLHLVGSLGEHHPAEELGHGAVVGSVDTFPDGHDADALLGELCLDLYALVEIPADPVQPGDRDSVVGPNSSHQLILGWAGHGAAGHLVGEDAILTKPEFLDDVELRFQVPSGSVGLADPGVAVGYGAHQGNLAQGPLC